MLKLRGGINPRSSLRFYKEAIFMYLYFELILFVFTILGFFYFIVFIGRNTVCYSPEVTKKIKAALDGE